MEDVNPSEIKLKVRASGYEPITLENIYVEQDKTSQVDVALYASACLRGRVIDARTGKPLAGIHVRAYTPRSYEWDMAQEYTGGFPGFIDDVVLMSDSAGEFQIDAIDTAKGLSFIAWGPGFAVAVRPYIVCPNEGVPRDVVQIAMEPEAQLVVTVDEPVEGLSVQILCTDAPVEEGPYENLASPDENASNVYVFNKLASGNYTVTARKTMSHSIIRVVGEVETFVVSGKVNTIHMSLSIPDEEQEDFVSIDPGLPPKPCK